MAYATADLNLMQSAPGNGPNHWHYSNSAGDTSVTILAANFISDAQEKGMKAGDIVFTVLDTGAAATYAVTTVASTGADLT